MKLKLKCKCGKVLIVPSSAAGKRAKCPECGERILIPKPKPKPKAAPKAPVKVATDNTDELPGFKVEDGSDSAADNGGVCTGCGEFMPGGAVICMNCGFNRVTGEQVVEGGEERDVSGFSKRTMIIAASVLLLLLLAGVGYTFLHKGNAPLPAAVDMIPQDVNMLAALDIQKLVTIPLIAEQLDSAQEKMSKDVMGALGLTLMDVDKIWIGFKVTGTKGRDDAVGAAVVQLLKDVDEKAFAEASKSVSDSTVLVVTLAGETAYHIKNNANSDNDFHLVFLSPTVLGVGDAPYVEKVIELARGRSTEAVSGNVELMSLCAIDSRDEIFWIGMQVPDTLTSDAAEGPMAPPVKIEDVKSVFVSGDYTTTDGIDLDVTLQSVSASVAEEAAKKMQGFVPMLQMITQMDFSKSLRIYSEQESIQINISLKPDMLDQIKEKIDAAK